MNQSVKKLYLYMLLIKHIKYKSNGSLNIMIQHDQMLEYFLRPVDELSIRSKITVKEMEYEHLR
jgi:hypothetical protein